MTDPIDNAALPDLRAHLQDERHDAEKEAAAALLALSSHLFVCPGFHDGLRGSAPYRRWRECTERVRRLQEVLDEHTVVP